MKARLAALAVTVICALFALFMACLCIIAYTWDTPNRVAAIVWMLAAFVLATLVGALYQAQLAKARTPLFADLQREWHKDQVILERIVADDEA